MFPILSAAPPPGEEDPEDEEGDTGEDSENPKHFAVQVGLFYSFILLIFLHKLNFFKCLYSLVGD